MEIKVFKEVTQRNLELNFPRHNIAIPISGSGEKLGQNFEKIMTSVQTMTDRFGLCGVIAMHVNGLLTNPKNWSDISYDPVVLKQMFDKSRATGEGESAWTWFDKNYRNKLTGGPNDFAVIDHNKIEAVLPSLAPYQPKVFNADSWQEALVFQQANIASKQNGVVVLDTSTFSGLLGGAHKNDGMAVAVLCEYPLQKGVHTHWLSAKPTEQTDMTLISGDLKPFGIDAIGINVPTQDVLNAITKVIGASPTTKLTKALAQHEQGDQGRNLHNEKMFLSNFVRRAF